VDGQVSLSITRMLQFTVHFEATVNTKINMSNRLVPLCLGKGYVWTEILRLPNPPPVSRTIRWEMQISSDTNQPLQTLDGPVCSVQRAHPLPHPRTPTPLHDVRSESSCRPTACPAGKLPAAVLLARPHHRTSDPPARRAERVPEPPYRYTPTPFHSVSSESRRHATVPSIPAAAPIQSHTPVEDWWQSRPPWPPTPLHRRTPLCPSRGRPFLVRAVDITGGRCPVDRPPDHGRRHALPRFCGRGGRHAAPHICGEGGNGFD